MRLEGSAIGIWGRPVPLLAHCALSTWTYCRRRVHLVCRCRGARADLPDLPRVPAEARLDATIKLPISADNAAVGWAQPAQSPRTPYLGNFISTHRVTLDICRHFQQFVVWRKFHGLCVGEGFRYDKHDETSVQTIAISLTISCARIRSCCARCFSFV
jgi:hypothetical protein